MDEVSYGTHLAHKVSSVFQRSPVPNNCTDDYQFADSAGSSCILDRQYLSPRSRGWRVINRNVTRFRAGARDRSRRRRSYAGNPGPVLAPRGAHLAVWVTHGAGMGPIYVGHAGSAGTQLMMSLYSGRISRASAISEPLDLRLTMK